MLVDILAVCLKEIAVVAAVGDGGVGDVAGPVDHLRACGVVDGVEACVQVEGGALMLLAGHLGIALPRPQIDLGVTLVGVVTLVEARLERVYGYAELRDVHGLVAALEEVFAALAVGKRRDVYGDGLFAEVDGGHGVRAAGILAAAKLGISVSVVKGEDEVAVVHGRLHGALLGHYDRCLFPALLVVVDDDVLQGVAVLRLAADADHIAVDLLVVFARAYVDGRLLACDVVEGLAIAHHGLGHDVVGEIEGHASEQQHNDGHGHHDPADAYAAGLHGYKFVLLAEVAHGHDRGEEHGDRQRHGHKGG